MYKVYLPGRTGTAEQQKLEASDIKLFAWIAFAACVRAFVVAVAVTSALGVQIGYHVGKA